MKRRWVSEPRLLPSAPQPAEAAHKKRFPKAKQPLRGAKGRTFYLISIKLKIYIYIAKRNIKIKSIKKAIATPSSPGERGQGRAFISFIIMFVLQLSSCTDVCAPWHQAGEGSITPFSMQLSPKFHLAISTSPFPTFGGEGKTLEGGRRSRSHQRSAPLPPAPLQARDRYKGWGF